MTNILGNPSVGLIFFIPGFEDTLRINGRAVISKDPTLLQASVVNNRAPKVVIRVAVDEAFLHCAKALKRSKLWDPSVQVDRKIMPSLSRMILEQMGHVKSADAAFLSECDRELEEDYKQNLY